MNIYSIGAFIEATAGHDYGKCYVIIRTDKEYVYLVDGKIRTLNNPKRKKMKHIKMLSQSDQTLTDKLINHTIKNEEIKRAIKLYQNKKSSDTEE